MCASSCIKHYEQPFIWLTWDASSYPYVCLYCGENPLIHKVELQKKYRNKNEKHFFKEQKVGMLLQKKEQMQEE